MTLNNEKIIFWGVELNEEEKRQHRISYATLSKQFDVVLCNNITEIDPDIWDNVESGEIETYFNKDWEEITREEWEALEEQGEETHEQFKEFYQFFIIDRNGAEWLEQAGEVVLYSDVLDVFIWCVDHWGTSWAYVMTSIKLNEDFSSVESWQ